jgi:phosphoenolpyruvate-protein phosphotransferase (PTS system enzyme I)
VRSFHGQGLGGGIAIGRARVLRVGQLDVPLHILAVPQREAEVARFYQAINNAKSQLHSIALSLPNDAPPETRALIEVHSTMLDDPALSFAAQEKILDEGFNAHWAWVQQVDSMVAQFAEMDNEYLRERARDIQQIGQRVLVQLTAGRVDASIDGGAGEIIVAHDLDPAGLLHWKQAEGFAIDLGGVNSHTAIVARSLQRPSVIGLGAASEQVEDGMMVVLDGETGALTIEPSPEVLAAFRTKQAQQREQAQRRMQLVDVPATTLDGVNIVLQANIELPIEAAAALKQGAQGIGLFRSEFLFLDRDTLPTEEEQFHSYCAALNAMQGREVTIRTIDVGADKALPQQKVDPPANPALGERAIRFSLKHPEIFMVQLRALLRASAFGPIRILIPMLAHRFEVTATKELLAHAREQLQREGIAMAPSVPIGAMIEIPAAAIEADWFAQAFDFLSIGTNDLVQYTLAVDRTDHQVAQLYDSHHPAVLSLIRTTVNACLKYRKPVTVCGEMAGQPDSAQLLIGMGIRQLSMQPQSLLAVKERILKIKSEPNNV